MKYIRHTIHVCLLCLWPYSGASAAVPLSLESIYSGTINVPGEAHTFTFPGAAGQRLYLDSQDADGLNMNATFYSPGGTSFYSGNDDYDYGPFVLTESGNYSLQLSANGATTGSYQFRLLDLAAAAPLTLGTTLSDQLSPNLACNIYQFNGIHGQRVNLQSISSSGTQVQWKLVSPANVVLASAQFYQNLGAITLPVDGAYCLLISGYSPGSTPLTFQLLVSDISDSAAATTGFGIAHSGNVSANQTNSFNYTAPAGLPVYFDSLDTSGQSLVVDLMDPFGNAVFSITETSDAGPYVLPRSGTYTLNVRGPGGSSGNFNFRLLDLSTSTVLPLNSVVSNLLSAPYQTDVYKLSGTPGQRLYYDSQLPSYVNVQTRLQGPDGQIAINGNSAYDSGPVTISFSGTYYLFQQSSLANPISYVFQVLDAGTQPILPLNTNLTGSLTANASAMYQLQGNKGQLLYFNGNPTTSGGAYWTLYNTINAQVGGAALSGDFEASLSYSGNYLLVITAGASDVSFTNLVHTVVNTTNLLTLGVAVTNNISNPGDQLFYTFSGTAGQRLYFDSLNPNYLSINQTIISPAGAPLPTGNASLDYGPVTLTQSGTYTLLFNSFLDTIGGISFRLLDIGVQSALPINTDLTGTLDANQSVVFQLTGTNGERLYFNSKTTNPGNSSWNLYGPNNAEIAGASLGADFEVTLPYDGKYLVVLVGGTTSVVYSNQVNTFSYVTNSLTLGSIVTNNIVNPGDQLYYTFAGTTGQRVYFDAINPNYFSGYVTLISPSGMTLATANPSSDFGPVTLPEDGLYNLVIDFNIDVTGGVSFRLLDVASQPALPINTDFSVALPPDATAIYQLPGAAGGQFYFNSEQVNGGGGSWTLYGPNDAWVNAANLPGDFEVNLSYAGNYVLVVAAGQNALSFTNQVNTFGYVTNALTPGTPVTSTIIKPGDQRYFTFTGSAGQRLYYDSRQTNYNTVSITLLSPTGTTVVYGNSYYDYGPFTLTQNGTYTLILDGNADAVGAVAFNLLDLAAAAPVTLGSTINDSLTDPTETRLYRFAGTAGQRVNLQGGGTPGNQATWALIGLTDQLMANSQFVPASIGIVTLPVAGNYLLEVVGNGTSGSLGNYQLNLTDVSDASVGVSGFGVVHSGTIGANQTNSFTLTAPAGLPVYFDSQDKSGQSLVVDLFGPDSALIFDITETADSGPYILPRSGTYTLNIRGYNGASGNYSFRLLDLSASPNLTLNSAVGSLLANPYQMDVYQFTSSAGQTLIYDALTNDVNNSLIVQMLNPRGQYIGPSGDFANDRGPFSVHYSGTCYLFLSHTRDVPDAYSFRMLDVATQPVLPLNISVTNSLDVYPTMVYRYSGAAGQRLYFRGQPTNPTGYWELFDPNNSGIASPGLLSDFDVILPFNGTYTLALYNTGTSSGPEVFNVNDYTYFTNFYTLGTPVVDSISRPGERRFYTFNGSLGQRLVYDALTNDPPSPNSIQATLLNPQGVPEGPIGGSFSYDRQPFTLQHSGAYTLVIDGISSSVGTFAFVLLDLASQPVLPVNVGVTNTLGVYAQEVYRYSGKTRQQLYFQGDQGNPNGFWTLYDPNNAGVSAGYSNTRNDFEVTLPLDGTYTLVLSSYNTTAGTEVFKVNDFTYFTNNYTIGSSVIDSIQRPGERRSYMFTGVAGQRLIYDALTNDPPGSYGIDAELLNPQGQVEGPIGGRFSTDRGPFTLQQSGIYTLLVDGEVSETGTFAFRLLDVSAQTILPVNSTVTNILGPYPLIVYQYAGIAGQNLYFRGDPNNPYGYWTLYDPNNSPLTGGYSSLIGDLKVTLPYNGTYVLLMGSYLTTAGTEIFAVNPFDFGESLSLNRAPVLNHISDQLTGERQSLTFTAQAQDPDNDALTFSLDPGAPTGAAINPTNGVFTWTPPSSGFSYMTNVTVRVTDNGTPPSSAAQLLSIEVIAGPVMLTVQRSGTNATVFWRTAPGKHYQLQYSNSISPASWTDIGTVLGAVDFITSEVDNTIDSHNERFYRVRLLDP